VVYDPNEVLTELRADSDWTELLTFYSSPDQSVPRDFTNYTATAALQRRGSSDAPLTLTTTNGFLSFANNTILISVAAGNSQKANSPPDVYDLFMVLISPLGAREEVPSWAYNVVFGDAP